MDIKRCQEFLGIPEEIRKKVLHQRLLMYYEAAADRYADAIGAEAQGADNQVVQGFYSDFDSLVRAIMATQQLLGGQREAEISSHGDLAHGSELAH